MDIRSTYVLNGYCHKVNITYLVHARNKDDVITVTELCRSALMFHAMTAVNEKNQCPKVCMLVVSIWQYVPNDDIYITYLPPCDM